MAARRCRSSTSRPEPSSRSTPSAELHANPVPTNNATECETGNEPFAEGQQIGNPAGTQPNRTEETTAPAAATARGARGRTDRRGCRTMSLLRRAPKRPSRHVTPAVGLGVIGAVALVLITFFAFTKDIPFTDGYRSRLSSRARTACARARRCGSPASRSARSSASSPVPGATRIVRFDARATAGRPIHRDATLQDPPAAVPRGRLLRRPRTRQPERSGARDGGHVPLPQTAIPVQFDQILSDVRRSRSARACAAPSRSSTPRSTTAARGRRREGRRAAGPALRDTAIVSEAARGTRRPTTSSRLVRRCGARRRPRSPRGGRTSAALLGSLAITSHDPGVRVARACARRLRELDGAAADGPGVARRDRRGRCPPPTGAPGRRCGPACAARRRSCPASTACCASCGSPRAPRSCRGLLDDLRADARALPTALGPPDRSVPARHARSPTACVSACVPGPHVQGRRRRPQHGPSGLAGARRTRRSASRPASGGASTPTATGCATWAPSATRPSPPASCRASGRRSSARPASRILGVRPTWLGPGVEPPLRPDVPCMDQRAARPQGAHGWRRADASRAGRIARNGRRRHGDRARAAA